MHTLCHCQTCQPEARVVYIIANAKPWESIPIDFLSELPTSRHGNDCVFVVDDRFSKMTLMLACKLVRKTLALKMLQNYILVTFG